MSSMSDDSDYSGDEHVQDDDSDYMQQDEPTPADEDEAAEGPEFDFPTNDLTIDLYDYKNQGPRSASMEAFDTAVALHEEKGVNSLNIRWFTQDNSKVEEESLRVHSWLNSVVKGNVKDMQLNFMLPENKPFVLPSFVQGCESLSVLCMDMHRRTLELQSSVGFVWLITLTLKDVKLVSSIDNVVSLSKMLKRLNLEEVSGLEKLEISSNSLQELSITKTRTDDLNSIHIECQCLKTLKLAWYFTVPNVKYLELSASKLKSLNWRGDTVQSCDFDTFATLDEAVFNFRPPLVKINEKMKASLVGLVQGVDRVKKLELNCWHIEILTKDCHLGTYHNVSDLVINVWDFNEEHQTPAIASFLGLFPKLQNISFKNCRQPWGVRVGELMGLKKSMYADREAKDMLSQLVTVLMELTGGNKELELAGYLAKKARNLKKMTILYSMLETERSVQINKAISKFEKASSNVVTLSLPYV